MTTEVLSKTIAIVENVLAANLKATGNKITASSTMEGMPEWDSLNFINIFLDVNEAFGIDPEPDDALHYNSISNIVTFVSKELTRK